MEAAYWATWDVHQGNDTVLDNFVYAAYGYMSDAYTNASDAEDYYHIGEFFIALGDDFYNGGNWASSVQYYGYGITAWGTIRDYWEASITDYEDATVDADWALLWMGY